MDVLEASSGQNVARFTIVYALQKKDPEDSTWRDNLDIPKYKDDYLAFSQYDWNDLIQKRDLATDNNAWNGSFLQAGAGFLQGQSQANQMTKAKIVATEDNKIEVSLPFKTNKSFGEEISPLAQFHFAEMAIQAISLLLDVTKWEVQLVGPFNIEFDLPATGPCKINLAMDGEEIEKIK